MECIQVVRVWVGGGRIESMFGCIHSRAYNIPLFHLGRYAESNCRFVSTFFLLSIRLISRRGAIGSNLNAKLNYRLPHTYNRYILRPASFEALSLALSPLSPSPVTRMLALIQLRLTHTQRQTRQAKWVSLMCESPSLELIRQSTNFC